jgi:hypothetical protein
MATIATDTMIAVPIKTNETTNLFEGEVGVGVVIICAVLELTKK